MKQPVDRNNVWAFHSQVQGVANAVAELLSDAIGEQDEALLAMLQTELRTVREWILGNKQSPKVVFEKLESVHRQIVEIEHRGVQNALTILQGQASNLASIAGQHAANEIQSALMNERNIRRKSFGRSELTDREIKNMLDYKPFVDGKTIQQWFGDLEYNISSRIFQCVQKGIIEGMTLNSVMQTIRGIDGFKPGVLQSGILRGNRQSAEILARTVINATANQSRLEMYRANADVIDGVQWLATLDHRTCLICGAYDGRIWAQDKLYEVKVPPAHPNCRCVLIPYIDIDGIDADGGTRPAEAENFDLLAKKKYEAKPSAKKKYNELSYEYRRKLRYVAMEEFRQQTGNSPYRQVKGGMTFADYLQSQPESFQREWLGVTRFALYQSGKLTLDQMVRPDSGFKRTIEELKKLLR
ncbi:MAG: minor capsid protein [Planctomycetaceae bacterium]|nr:minor capsid protein [Planctomycetaceae bacterium]